MVLGQGLGHGRACWSIQPMARMSGSRSLLPSQAAPAADNMTLRQQLPSALPGDPST